MFSKRLCVLIGDTTVIVVFSYILILFLLFSDTEFLVCMQVLLPREGQEISTDV
jgi:hypothetical protein